MTLHLELTGSEEAQESVRRIAAAVGDRQMREWAIEALEPVAEEARSLVRVDRGDVRSSIDVRAALPDGSHAQFGGQAVFVGAFADEAFHAWFLEFGTVKMAAYPFLTPALDAREGQVFDILGELAGKAILTAN